ncbi:hypothetical protein Tco_0992515 [Tanacetum coccineum]|uniref:Uncharacterized protein n=1 Tax=Tanacetum coccineum TaxID=301880 RepID=A0ABQ5F2B6_9ASTR
MSNPSIESFDASPVKMEASKELPKVSLVNESLKKLKFHVAKFDNVVKIRTTPHAHIEEKRIEREQAANLAVQKEQEEQAAQSFTLYWNFTMIDDDDEYTIQYREYLENSSKAITPDLPTEELDNSLSMGDDHLSIILETESDKLIKSSVENLVPIPRESEGIFDNMCDVPSRDKKHFDAKSDLMESLLNHDTPIVYSPKIDSLLEEFTGELAPINPIPLGIHEADFDPKEDIRLDDQMFYDYTSSDDDSFAGIDYVKASPPDSELVSIEEVEDDILQEMRSGSTTTHAENSLLEYDSFHFEIESDQGELSRAVMETIDEIDAFLISTFLWIWRTVIMTRRETLSILRVCL